MNNGLNIYMSLLQVFNETEDEPVWVQHTECPDERL